MLKIFFSKIKILFSIKKNCQSDISHITAKDFDKMVAFEVDDGGGIDDICL